VSHEKKTQSGKRLKEISHAHLEARNGLLGAQKGNDKKI